MKRLLFIFLLIALVFLDIFMISKIYELTIQPLGAPAIGLMQTWGIMIFVGSIMARSLVGKVNTKNEEITDMLAEVLGGTLSVALGLLIAWIFF